MFAVLQYRHDLLRQRNYQWGQSELTDDVDPHWRMSKKIECKLQILMTFSIMQILMTFSIIRDDDNQVNNKMSGNDDDDDDNNDCCNL